MGDESLYLGREGKGKERDQNRQSKEEGEKEKQTASNLRRHNVANAGGGIATMLLDVSGSRKEGTLIKN